MLGFLAVARGDYPQARSAIEEALSLSRQAHDTRGILVGVSNLGHLAAQRGRFDEALPLIREALLLAHEFLDVNGVANELEVLAWVAASQRECEPAAILLGGAEALHEATESAFEPVGAGAP